MFNEQGPFRLAKIAGRSALLRRTISSHRSVASRMRCRQRAGGDDGGGSMEAVAIKP
jgi:hypothetical protein